VVDGSPPRSRLLDFVFVDSDEELTAVSMSEAASDRYELVDALAARLRHVDAPEVVDIETARRRPAF